MYGTFKSRARSGEGAGLQQLILHFGRKPLPNKHAGAGAVLARHFGRKPSSNKHAGTGAVLARYGRTGTGLADVDDKMLVCLVN